jgi:LacI family transcriptional regulator
MPNIYDVAKRARVSVATVSAVLNDSAFVSADLKGRVETAVAALGYQPNLLARSMAKQRTQTLGMIVPDIANPFFPEVVRGAEDTAHAAGYTLLIASSDNDVKKEEIYLRLFLAKRVDGIILTKAPGRLPVVLQDALAKAGVPIVLLARTVPGFTTDVVGVEGKGGG